MMTDEDKAEQIDELLSAIDDIISSIEEAKEDYKSCMNKDVASAFNKAIDALNEAQSCVQD
jgi:hypothetical protein